MDRARAIAALTVVAFQFAVAVTQGGIIAYFGGDRRPDDQDSQVIAHLESLGHAVTYCSPSRARRQAQLELADASDLVIISETIRSSSVSSRGRFTLQETTTPVISFEAYMFDDANWTGSNPRTDFGSTAGSKGHHGSGGCGWHLPRPGKPHWPRWAPGTLWGAAWTSKCGRSHPWCGDDEFPEPPQGPTASIFLTNPSHPMSAGLSGETTVYSPASSLNWALESSMGEAVVIATADAEGLYPVLFLYEPGSELADGAITPGMRIGMFIGPSGKRSMPWSSLTPDGVGLFDAAVAYAIVPEPSAIALLGVGLVSIFALRRRRR